MELRTKIARAIHDGPAAQVQYLKAGIAPHGFENCRYSEQYFNDADAVLAVLDLGEIRAEALRDVARVLTDALPESPSAAQTDRMNFAIGFLNASAENPYRKADR